LRLRSCCGIAAPALAQVIERAKPGTERQSKAELLRILQRGGSVSACGTWPGPDALRRGRF
jgi:hypothetical protein